jgi:hypothetical protein
VSTNDGFRFGYSLLKILIYYINVILATGWYQIKVDLGLKPLKSDLLMAIKKDYPEKYGWWISELNSLGMSAKDE